MSRYEHTEEKIEVPHIDKHRKASIKLMGNVSEISISDRLGSGATILPVSKDEFVQLSTGELREFTTHANNRTENRRNLEKTMRHLSDIINANVTPENIECCRFITLTYHENQRNPQRFYNDFKLFNQKFKRHINKLGLCYQYIFVLEAQARGALHSHIIYIFDSVPPFLDSSLIATMWGHGFISVKALSGNADNIGQYLTAYLSDLPAEDNPSLEALTGSGNIKEVDVDGKKKRILKGARLALIPAGTRIFRYSRGIKRPLIIRAPYSETLEYLADMGYQKTYESAFELSDPESDFKSTCVKQVFKKYINPAQKRKEYHK